MTSVWIALVLAVAATVLFLTRADTRQFLNAVVTRTSWERSMQVADGAAGIGSLEAVEVFVATAGPYAPGYVAMIKLDDPHERVLVSIADPDSRAGFPIDMEDDGIPRADLAAYVAGWNLRGVVEPRYRDALLLRHFQNVLT